jgi:UDP-N-acetylmuramyl pentapeptide phosphotransferase/UDP-N-acetylglucosamine-1-phosphate transferase
MPSLAADLGCVALAGAATGGMLHLLLRFRHRLPLDVANARSLHQGSIPRIGGLAMWTGGALAAICLAFSDHESGSLQGIVLASAGLALISYLDDSRGLATLPRLAAHFAAAGVAASLLAVAWPVAVGLVLTLVWMTNLYNFMDGADGLAGGMTLFGFAACGVAAAGAMPLLAVACFAIAATAAGFLIFNFHPARVFMGDAGSIPLGFLAGALGLLGWSRDIWPLWFPCLVFSPFIVDATLTLMRRAWRREKVWQAHREHYYQRLVRMGWGHRRTAFAEYGLMVGTSASALLLLSLPPPLQALGLLLWAMIYAGLAWQVDRAWREGQQR